MRLLLRSEEHTSELQSPCNLVCVFCLDRKSTRLNSSHLVISYAVFCLKKNIKFTTKSLCLTVALCFTVIRVQRSAQRATDAPSCTSTTSHVQRPTPPCVLFFFNDTATTEIYTLSLHDALPISVCQVFPDASVILRIAAAPD